MTRIRDKWGLPRRWLFWRDWLFWLFAAYDVTIILHFAIGTFKGSLNHLELWVILLFVALSLVNAGIKYGMLYDSYRWEMPHRTFNCLVTFWCWPVGLGLYLQGRPEWMLEIINRQDKPL